MMLVSEPSIGEAGTGERSSPVGGDRRASTACRARRGSAQCEGTCGPQGHPLRRDLGGHSWQPPPQHAEGGTPSSLPTGCSCRGARGAHGAGQRILGVGWNREGERCGMLTLPRLCCDLKLGNTEAGLGLPLGLGLRLLHPAALGSGRVRWWEEAAAEPSTRVPAPAERLPRHRHPASAPWLPAPTQAPSR